MVVCSAKIARHRLNEAIRGAEGWGGEGDWRISGVFIRRNVWYLENVYTRSVGYTIFFAPTRAYSLHHKLPMHLTYVGLK